MACKGYSGIEIGPNWHDLTLTFCTSQNNYSVFSTVEQVDKNAGFTTTYTAYLQRRVTSSVWDTIDQVSGSVYATGSSNRQFDNIASPGAEMQVKYVTSRGTFYSPRFFR